MRSCLGLVISVSVLSVSLSSAEPPRDLPRATAEQLQAWFSRDATAPPRIIHLWASWCLPCVAEWAYLAAATAAVLVLGLARFAATDTTAPGAAPSYDIQGKYYETCACSVSCPCASNATLPTEGHCDAISLVHIDKGTIGDTKLDGLNVA